MIGFILGVFVGAILAAIAFGAWLSRHICGGRP